MGYVFLCALRHQWLTLTIMIPVAPFGYLAPVRSDLLDKDMGKKYWEWTEKQVNQYL